MTAATTIDRIRGFIEAQGKQSGRAVPETVLQGDLGLDGHDAFEFMEAFAEQFGVARGDFDFHRYFGPEGFNPFTLIASLFSRKPPLVPITVAMLVRAAELGEWRTAEIEKA